MPDTSEQVDVILAHPVPDLGGTGERVTIDAREARRLVNAGHASYANKPAAKKAEGK